MESAHTIGYATIKWLTNGSQLHHLRFEIQGLEVNGWVVSCWYSVLIVVLDCFRKLYR